MCVCACMYTFAEIVDIVTCVVWSVGGRWSGCMNSSGGRVVAENPLSITYTVYVETGC